MAHYRPSVTLRSGLGDRLSTLVLFSVLLTATPHLWAVWVAFDDHTRGPGTGTNVSVYSLRSPGGGPLIDELSGVVLPAGVAVTSSGNPIAVRFGAAPATNTPAWQVFNGQVDFFTIGSADNGSLIYASSNQSITLTFTNLDPARHYSFRGTSIRGGIDDGTEANNFHRRWTLCSLVGAAAFSDAHSTGCVTRLNLPTSGLAPGQAAYNSGMNQTNGDVVGWDDIVAGQEGSFSVVQTQYQGPIWGGDTASATNEPGYAINGFRLQETSAGWVFGLTSPALNSRFVLPAQILISASSSGSQSSVTNVAFYANSVELARFPGAPCTFIWSNPPPATYELAAVGWDSAGNAITSAVVNVSVTNNSVQSGIVYLVVGSDTAVWNDGSTVDVFARHPYYPPDLFTEPSSPSFAVMDPAWRGRFTDSAGQPVKFTWWLLGGNIYRDAANLNVPNPNSLVPYLMKKYHGEAVRFFGDELSLHYHTFIWSDYVGAGNYCWNQAQTFHDCREDFDYTLAQYLLDEEIFPVSFRSGWHYMDNEWQQYLDQLLPFTLHDNWPVAKAWDTNQPVNNVQDWSRAPSAFVPFHPATNDYQLPGTGTGWNVRSIKMQNTAQSDLSGIFDKAANGVDQVACIWNHLPESFVTNFVRVDSLVHTAAAGHPGIPFYYCTAVEAMQRWLGTTNRVPPEIDISERVQGQTVTLVLWTSKPIFQPQPFVALRDASGQYSNVTVLCVAAPATNSWTITLPVPRNQLAKVGVAVTDLAGNLATRILRYLPDDIYVDNLDPQYSEIQGEWSSTAESAWGTDARMARLGPNDTVQARWLLLVPSSGTYSLAIQVPWIPNPATNLWFNISSGGSNVSTVFFPSALPPLQWVDLGSVRLNANQSNWVDMTVNGTIQPGTWAVADVVRVVPLPDAATAKEPLLTGVLTQNGFVVQYRGVSGLNAQFERSLDLAQWTTVATMPVPPSGVIEYQETNPPGAAAFYRCQTR